MQIQIANELSAQQAALAAGFENVEAFVNSLLKRESDRLAVQEGIKDAEAGNLIPFDEFDRDIRQRNGFAPPTDA